jgi:hypothetical protein
LRRPVSQWQRLDARGLTWGIVSPIKFLPIPIELMEHNLGGEMELVRRPVSQLLITRTFFGQEEFVGDLLKSLLGRVRSNNCGREANRKTAMRGEENNAVLLVPSGLRPDAGALGSARALHTVCQEQERAPLWAVLSP